jgi:hypothetical protein
MQDQFLPYWGSLMLEGLLGAAGLEVGSWVLWDKEINRYIKYNMLRFLAVL